MKRNLQPEYLTFNCFVYTIITLYWPRQRILQRPSSIQTPRYINSESFQAIMERSNSKEFGKYIEDPPPLPSNCLKFPTLTGTEARNRRRDANEKGQKGPNSANSFPNTSGYARLEFVSRQTFMLIKSGRRILSGGGTR